jgi:hypothetical protein
MDIAKLVRDRVRQAVDAADRGDNPTTDSPSTDDVNIACAVNVAQSGTTTVVQSSQHTDITQTKRPKEND